MSRIALEMQVPAFMAAITMSCALAMPVAAAVGDEPRAGAPSGLEEVVVTARKREESVQEVPTAVTAVTGAMLEAKGITRIDRLSETVPNVTIQNNPSITGSVVTFIRGIGSRAVEPTTDAANALSVDGVYFAGVSAGLLDTFDVQQVEVLRGPQGTLQGRNATGGAINITTRRPSLTDAHLKAEAGYGRFNTRIGKVSGETPLIADKLAIKVAVMSTGSDGFMKHEDGIHRKGDINYSFGRVGALFTPTEDFSAYLTYDYLHDTSGQVGNQPADGITAIPRTETGGQVTPLICTAFGECRNYPHYRYSSNENGGTNTKSWGSALTLDWSLNSAIELTSVTGFRDIHDLADNDVDATRVGLVAAVGREVTTRQLSQEVRLASKKDASRLDWVLGVYHLRYDFRLVQPIRLDALGVVSIDDRSQAAHSNALFGNGDYAFTDQWHVFAGGRTQKDRKDFTGISPLSPRQKKSWSNTIGEAGVRYFRTPHEMWYFRFAQGSRPGGFTPSGTTFDQEKVNSWELGSKFDAFDRRLVMSTSVFNYKYKDMQRDVTIPIDVAPFFQETVKNAATASIWGAEAEFAVAPTEPLRITGSAGYLHAKYDHFPDFNTTLNQTVDNKALRLPFTPHLTASLSGSYAVPLPRLQVFRQAVLGLDMTYKSKLNTGVVDIPLADQSGYSLLNASIRFDDPDQPDRYWVSLWVNNLTNKYYIIAGEPIATLGAYVVPGMPRTYGIRFGVGL